MKIKILVVLLFFSVISHAQTLNTKCSSNGLSVLYLNGINSTPGDGIKEIKKATIAIQGKLDEAARSDSGFSQIPVQWDGLKNPKEGLLDDISEFLIQKNREKTGKKSTTLEEDMLAAEMMLADIESNSIVQFLAPAFILFDFKSILRKYTTAFLSLLGEVRTRLENGKKVLVIAHSQGNMFMQEIKTRLLNDPDPRIRERAMYYLKDYPVGSPATHNKMGPSFKLFNDKATGLFGDSAKYSMTSGTPFHSLVDPLSHGFTETYMNSSLVVTNFETGEQSYARNIVINDIVQIAQSFPPNCCHNSTGKSSNGRYRPSQGNSNFVSDYASVDSNVGLSDGAEVCGGAVRGNVTVRGNVWIYDSANIYGSAPGVEDSIEINSTSNKPIIISGGNISGQGVRISSGNAFGKSLIIKDDAEIQGCNTSITQDDISNEMIIGDSSKILGNVSLLSSSILDDAVIEGNTEAPCNLGNSQVWRSNISGNSLIKTASVDASSVLDGVVKLSVVSNSSVSGSHVENYSSVSKSDITSGSQIEQSAIESSSINGSFVMSNSRVGPGSMINSCVVINSTLTSVSFAGKNLTNCVCDGQNDSDPEDPCAVCMNRFFSSNFEI